MPRRRFGVSVPEHIANWLDKLAKRLGIDRSRLVERALESFLHEHAHYLYEHDCRGVMIAVSKDAGVDFARIVEKYRDIVVSSLHQHIDGFCLEILVVKGPSTRIAELHSDLENISKCTIRYVPFSAK
ncbi:nickel-responsive transcriptional regulator NikR [Pyrofollis japonicus]|uniref:CopG family ribbon-helix-helix protein n=1 Tax=Pyrofollis japonicus TaxID=3060460 RepID=UPI00295B46C8|nr:CopG family ribbon-helix-helix protein [Pyrofollis japonicus]BEP18531.1 nickel-responsive transcriptional regulator NikR [Pyrofollis japonicus]